MILVVGNGYRSVLVFTLHVMEAAIQNGHVMDTMYRRTDPLTTGGCYLNIEAQLDWAISVQFLVYDLPPVLMILAYPVIWYAQRTPPMLIRNGESLDFGVERRQEHKVRNAERAIGLERAPPVHMPLKVWLEALPLNRWLTPRPQPCIEFTNSIFHMRFPVEHHRLTFPRPPLFPGVQLISFPGQNFNQNANGTVNNPNMHDNDTNVPTGPGRLQLT